MIHFGFQGQFLKTCPHTYNAHIIQNTRIKPNTSAHLNPNSWVFKRIEDCLVGKLCLFFPKLLKSVKIDLSSPPFFAILGSNYIAVFISKNLVNLSINKKNDYKLPTK